LQRTCGSRFQANLSLRCRLGSSLPSWPHAAELRSLGCSPVGTPALASAVRARTLLSFWDPVVSNASWPSSGSGAALSSVSSRDLNGVPGLESRSGCQQCWNPWLVAEAGLEATSTSGAPYPYFAITARRRPELQRVEVPVPDSSRLHPHLPSRPPKHDHQDRELRRGSGHLRGPGLRSEHAASGHQQPNPALQRTRFARR
jgi:hypothetical protein